MSEYQEIIELYQSLGYSAQQLTQWASPEHDLAALVNKVSELKPKKILEIGTFVGFATLAMARATPSSTVIHSIDPNLPLSVEMGSLKSITTEIPETLTSQSVAQAAAEKAGVSSKIRFHKGGSSTGNTYASLNSSPAAAVEVVGPKVCAEFGPFDFIFVDGLHYSDAVLSDLELATNSLTPGGVIALDDTLDLRWGPHVRDGLFRFLERHPEYVLYQDRNWSPMVDIAFLKHFPDQSKKYEINATYDDAFFKHCQEMHQIVVPHLAQELYRNFHPKSVLDLGCGAGMWLKAFRECGVEDIFGIDGSSSAWGVAHSLHRFMAEHDLRQVYVPQHRYDLCLCLDVIEHLEPEFEDNMIRSCVAASDTVVFSTPPPGQGGDGHVNERPIAHWMKKFLAHGYVLIDSLRPHFEGMSHLPETTYQLNTYIAKKMFEPGELSSHVADLLCEKERRIEALFLQNLFQQKEIHALQKDIQDERTKTLSARTSLLCDVPMVEFTIPTGFINQEEGFCYNYQFRSVAGLMFAPIARYLNLALYEDGKPLPLPNSDHDEIRSSGEGAFSFWTRQLYFSSSDNSDPRKNGRRYTFSIPEFMAEKERAL